MVIGVTGGFCTGKSKVASMFKKFGAKVIDLDRLAHKALRPGTKSAKKITQEFGREILVNNAINRFLLAKKVFGNKAGLAKLNSIVHPLAIKEMCSLIKRAKKSDMVVIEAPLLFEAGLRNYFDYIVVVKADKDMQIRRAIKKTGLNRSATLKRINSQMLLSEKIGMADFVIDNNGSVNNTYKQVKGIWRGFYGIVN